MACIKDSGVSKHPRTFSSVGRLGQGPLVSDFEGRLESTG